MTGVVGTNPKFALAFVNLFVNEYVHYGDALDGKDAVLDENGNVVNDPNSSEPSFGDGVFDEGNFAAEELFPLPSGRENYHLYSTGTYLEYDRNVVIDIVPEDKDPTVLPQPCRCFGPDRDRR